MALATTLALSSAGMALRPTSGVAEVTAADADQGPYPQPAVTDPGQPALRLVQSGHPALAAVRRRRGLPDVVPDGQPRDEIVERGGGPAGCREVGHHDQLVVVGPAQHVERLRIRHRPSFHHEYRKRYGTTPPRSPQSPGTSC